MNKKTIAPLQAFRVFAITLIFLLHESVVRDAQVAVTFFIVLSGFLSGYLYFNKEQHFGLRRSASFALHRVRRLYPLHVITFVIAFILFYQELVAYPFHSIIKGILNLALVQSFVPNQAVYFSFNGVSWYLSLTLFLYFVTGGFIFLARKLHGKVPLVAVIGLVCVLQVVLEWLWKDSQYAAWLVEIDPIFRSLDYFNGLLVGVLFLATKEAGLRKATLKEIACIAMVTAVSVFRARSAHHPYVDVYLGVACMLLIYVFAFEGGWISRLLSKWTLVTLGGVTSAFFLIHGLVIVGEQRLTHDRHYAWAIVASFLTSWILSCGYRWSRLHVAAAFDREAQSPRRVSWLFGDRVASKLKWSKGRTSGRDRGGLRAHRIGEPPAPVGSQDDLDAAESGVVEQKRNLVGVVQSEPVLGGSELRHGGSWYRLCHLAGGHATSLAARRQGRDARA